jgi:hypothetical protein
MPQATQWALNPRPKQTSSASLSEDQGVVAVHPATHHADAARLDEHVGCILRWQVKFFQLQNFGASHLMYADGLGHAVE